MSYTTPYMFNFHLTSLHTETINLKYAYVHSGILDSETKKRASIQFNLNLNLRPVIAEHATNNILQSPIKPKNSLEEMRIYQIYHFLNNG